MTNNATPPTMNITEAADTLKIHPHSLEKIIRAGDIPAGRVGRAYVLMTRDVLAYAERIIIDQTVGRHQRIHYQSCSERSLPRRFA